MQRQMPKVPALKKVEVELANFRGMNNSQHPTLLPLNIPSNLQNSYFQNGVLDKRNGYTKFGNNLSGTVSIYEDFSTSTYKDPMWQDFLAFASSNNGDFNIGDVSAESFSAYQSFTGNGESIDTAKFLLKKKTSSTGTVTAYLYAHSGTFGISSVPTGSPLATSTGVSHTTLSSSAFTEITFTFSSPYTTVNGTKYCVLIKSVGGDVTYAARSDAWGDYHPGNFGFYNGDTATIGSPAPTADNTTDLCFYIGKSTGTNATWDTTLKTVYAQKDLIENSSTSNYDPGYDSYSMLVPDMGFADDAVQQLGFSYRNIPFIVSSYVYSCKFYLKRVGNPTGTITLNVYNTTGIPGSTGKPTGFPLVSSVSINQSSISTSISLVEFKFNSPIQLTGSLYTDKCFVLESSMGNLSNHIVVGANSSSPDGPYNACYQDGNGIWYTKSVGLPVFYMYAINTSNNTAISKGYDTSSDPQVYTTATSVTTPDFNSLGAITVLYSDSTDNSTWSSWTTDVTTLSHRYLRWKAVVTCYNNADPQLNSVSVVGGGAPILSMHSWTKAGTTEKYLLAVAKTNLYMYDSATGDYKIIKNNLTTDLKTTASAFSDSTSYLIITNGTDNVMRFNGKVSTGTITTSGTGHRTVTSSGTSKWKTASNADELTAGGQIKIGSTWYPISSITSDTVLVLGIDGPTVSTSAYEAYGVPDLAGMSTAGIGGGQLKGKYVATYKSQVMISGIPGYESWVQVSEYMKGTSWSYSADANGNPIFSNGSGAINVSTNDGQIITALVPFGNSVQVHKSDVYATKKSVYSLTRNVDVWTNYPISTEYAAVSQYATISSPNAVYFVDSTGIIVSNGVTFNKIDNEVVTTTAAMNQSLVQNSIAAYNVQSGSEFLFFGIPVDGATTNDHLLMYDLQLKGWGIMNGLNMGCFATYSDVHTPELYFGDQVSSSQVLKWNSGTSDNGQPIEWIYETPEIQLKQYFERKKFKYLYAFFEPTGSYTVHAYYSINGGAYTELTDTMTTSGSEDVFKRWALPGLIGSTVKFKFYNKEKDQPITLVRAGIVLVEKGLRRI